MPHKKSKAQVSMMYDGKNLKDSVGYSRTKPKNFDSDVKRLKKRKGVKIVGTDAYGRTMFKEGGKMKKIIRRKLDKETEMAYIDKLVRMKAKFGNEDPLIYSIRRTRDERRKMLD